MNSRICWFLFVIFLCGFALSVLTWGSSGDPQTGVTRKFNAGTWDRPLACQKTVPIELAGTGPSSSNTTTYLLVASKTNKIIYICGFIFANLKPPNPGGDDISGKIQLISGSGDDCEQNTADVTGPFRLPGNSHITYGGGTGTVCSAGQKGVNVCAILTGSFGFEIGGIITYGRY